MCVLLLLLEPELTIVLNFVRLIARQMQNLICLCCRWVILKAKVLVKLIVQGSWQGLLLLTCTFLLVRSSCKLTKDVSLQIIF